MSYSFLPDAEAGDLEAVRFYEGQRAGLGASLISEFERVIGLVVARPGAWKLVHPSGPRRIGLRQFPYTVFYRILPDDQPQVTAFAHHRRRLGYWLARIGS